MKIAVITSQAGNRGQIHDPLQGAYEGVDYVAFSDKPLNLNVWRTHKLHEFSQDPYWISRRNAKLPKMLAWMLLPGYDYYLWHDSVCDLQVHPQELIAQYLEPDQDIALWQHGHRHCSYVEAQTVKDHGFDHPHLCDGCIQFLQDHNWPTDAGLFEMSSFIYRNTFKMQQAMLTWWELVCRFSSRDQIMFPYVVHTHDIKYSVLPGRAMAYSGNNTLIPQVR